MDHNTKKRNLSLSTYLPSNKVRIFMLTTSVLLIIILLVAHSKNIAKNTTNPLTVTVGEAIQKDTDNDGVPDWQERLFGTNIYSGDSDGDGIPDATEIANQKDQISLQYGYGTSTYATNNTDAFARDLFVTYNVLKEQGTVSETSAEKIGQAAAEAAVEKLKNIPVHSAADFKTIPATTVNNEAYKKKLFELANKNPGFASEIALVNQGVTENNADVLRDAASYAKVYNTYATDLIKIQVPQNQLQNHVRLVNDVTYIANVLPYIDTLEDDVVKGVPLYTIYIKAYQDMFEAFEAIGKTQ